MAGDPDPNDFDYEVEALKALVRSRELRSRGVAPEVVATVVAQAQVLALLRLTEVLGHQNGRIHF